MLVEITCKLAFWQQLPWKLMHLSHHCKIEAAAGARRCLDLWEMQKHNGPHHLQTRRFLDPNYTSTFENDVPLRPLVEKMASGHDIDQPEFAPLRRWLARFAVIKIVERSTEGIHSLVSHALKRAPAASVGYLSVELRFHSFWERLAKNPLASGINFNHFLTLDLIRSSFDHINRFRWNSAWLCCLCYVCLRLVGLVRSTD